MLSLLRRFTISKRLYGLTAFFILGIFIYGLYSTSTLNKYKVTGPVYNLLVMNKDLIADILPPPEYIIESYLVTFQISKKENRASNDSYITRLKVLKEEFELRHAYWKTQPLQQDQADLILVKSYQPAQEFYAIAFNELIPAVSSENEETIDAVMLKLKKQYDQHLIHINELLSITNKFNAEFEKSALGSIKFGSTMELILLGLFLTMALMAAYFILKSILHPLDEAIEIAEIVATGNLKNSFDVSFNDEPGHLLKSLKLMNDHFSSTIRNIRASAELVSSTAKEIEMGNLDLSSRTEEQAGSLETTASTLEELTSTVKQNAENAALANKLVSSTSDVAVQGGEVVKKVVNNMELITQSSKKIEDIIGVIDGIAFQTNILALNAAVEAARAGEQGRGFAVVASEVRNLAQRSAAAAKEIKGLIVESVNTVDAGSLLVAEAGVNMTKIVSSIQQVSDLMSEIASASSEQSIGIEQVSTLLNQMDEVTQQNTALVEESAAASGTMQQEAENLRVEISKFLLDTDGQGVSRKSPRHTALY